MKIRPCIINDVKLRYPDFVKQWRRSHTGILFIRRFSQRRLREGCVRARARVRLSADVDFPWNLFICRYVYTHIHEYVVACLSMIDIIASGA